MERDIKPTYDELESYIERLDRQRTDAQATIAALQARVQELEAIKTPDDAFTYCAYCGEKSPVDEHNEDLAAHIKVCPKHPMRDVESQLAQRTAELEAAKGKLDIILRVSRGEPDDELAVDYGGLGWENDPAVLGVYNLRAELERVKGELLEATHNANVYQSLYSTGCMDRALLENDLRDIRTLILALPKVEGDITVSADPNGWYVMPLLIRCVTKEQADGIAALLQQRQNGKEVRNLCKRERARAV